MNELEENITLTILENKLKQLINRCDEQIGIINSYVQREREWKSAKLDYTKEIDALNDQIAELMKKEDTNE